ncbi:MAG: regulatory protein RecX [Actinomycetota bacterium]
MSGARRSHANGSTEGDSPTKRRGLSLHDRALRFLAVRPRSRREVRDRLRKAGFDPEDIEGEIERLEAAGLLDDDRFARDYAEHLVGNKGVGRRALASSLFAKGIDKETIDAVAGEMGGDEEERAEELARSRVSRLSGLDPAAAHRRLMGFLARRGYDASVCRRAASKALEVSDQGFR